MPCGRRSFGSFGRAFTMSYSRALRVARTPVRRPARPAQDPSDRPITPMGSPRGRSRRKKPS
eukprot:2500072-Alexandrium_andersonii.AAC.1